jgi:hypothetical protein
MTNNWTTVRTFKTAQFKVILDYTFDDDMDLSWADDETLEKIRLGDWGCYLFRVRVLHNGQEVAADYLGGSVYEYPADFATEHRQGSAYFPDMVATAIQEARAELTRSRPYIRTAA